MGGTENQLEEASGALGATVVLGEVSEKSGLDGSNADVGLSVLDFLFVGGVCCGGE